MEHIAVYPGSFDPITYGHLDIIRRASSLFDKVIIAVLINESKTPLFSIDERVKMLEEVVKDIPNTEVMAFKGLTVDFVKSVGAQVMVRGLRAVSDFEYELQMSHTNKTLAPELDTVFFTTNLEYGYVSSSLIKEIAKLGGDISKMVPPYIEEKVKEKFK
ncbi:MAG: pantetheine-phosphate adenylyltransferase [Eubacteriales bacterium]|nr:pantetheine-phosphate adenylyltransferase [Eubacteriales bacterium]